MKERFLPIGTVVLLKGGEKKLMITTYCVFPTGKHYENGKEVEPKKEMFEYGACTYPEGILNSDTTCAFNHDQIEKVFYSGYESEEQKEFNEKLNANYENVKAKFER